MEPKLEELLEIARGTGKAIEGRRTTSEIRKIVGKRKEMTQQEINLIREIMKIL